MTSTDLKLEEPGTLTKPGPVGRILRLALGLACLYLVVGLLLAFGELLVDGHIRPIVWNGLVFGLFLCSYIVNIGFSRSWKKWPAVLSASIFLAIGLINYVQWGNFESVILANVIWWWEIYLFTHLGLAFGIAAVIGTPGCEMRACHDLYSRITGIPTKEHHCPVGPLNPVDRWEARQAWFH